MAKKMYIGVNDVARKVKKGYIGVNGVARKVKKGYIGVNGVARCFFKSVGLVYSGQTTDLSSAREYLVDILARLIRLRLMHIMHR